MLYVFYGTDTFARREALDKLKAELDTDGSLQTNTVVLDGRQVSPQEIMAACDTVPFLAERRLVIVEGLLQRAGRGGRARRGTRATEEQGGEAFDDVPDALRPLLEYLDRLPETTVLVLLDDGVSSDAVLKRLQSHGSVEPCAPLKPREVQGWVAERARAQGLRIDARAVRLLADLVGSDRWLLANEIEKLHAYAGGEVVREEDVRSLVAAARDREGYLLADAVVEGKPAAALKLLQDLRAQGRVDAVLLATIEGRYRRLALAREMLDAGATSRQIGERLNARGYGLERLIEQASRHSLETIRAAYRRLVEAELDTKRGLFDEQLSTELLVQDLATLPSRAV